MMTRDSTRYRSRKKSSSHFYKLLASILSIGSMLSFASPQTIAQAASITSGAPYIIDNGSTSEALSISGNSSTPGAQADVLSYTNAPTQQWNLIAVGNGDYEIQNVTSGLALQMTGGSITEGAIADQESYGPTPTQEWRLNLQSNGQYEIQNVTSGELLSVQGNSAVDNALVNQWANISATTQDWTLIKQ